MKQPYPGPWRTKREEVRGIRTCKFWGRPHRFRIQPPRRGHCWYLNLRSVEPEPRLLSWYLWEGVLGLVVEQLPWLGWRVATTLPTGTGSSTPSPSCLPGPSSATGPHCPYPMGSIWSQRSGTGIVPIRHHSRKQMGLELRDNSSAIDTPSFSCLLGWKVGKREGQSGNLSYVDFPEVTQIRPFTFYLPTLGSMGPLSCKSIC